MPDGRRNNGGARKGAGNPGYGSVKFVKRKITEHAPLWWETWEQMMKGGWEQKKEAVREFNKLQAKVLPNVVEDEEGDKIAPVLVKIVRGNESNNV